MELLRAALRVDDLPVVIGKITDSGMSDDGTVMDYIDTVQKAQQDFVANDECAAYVTVTDDLSYLDDGWHYDTRRIRTARHRVCRRDDRAGGGPARPPVQMTPVTARLRRRLAQRLDIDAS